MRRNFRQISHIGSEILKGVRRNDGISRVQLARKLELAPSTVGIYVECLIREGFLLESEKVSRDFGRPPILLRPNPDGGRFIGVDFEARNIMAVVVDFSDQPLRYIHERIERRDSIEKVIEKIEKVISDVMPQGSRAALAIGVGVPGLVNSSKGEAIHYKYIDNWRNVPIADRLSKRFGIPVFLENNARTMALAELWFGQGRGLRDFVCIANRSGMGAGLILKGQLYCGAHHTAGAFGRWRISPEVELLESFHLSRKSGSAVDYFQLMDLASVSAIQEALQRALASGEESILRNRKNRVTLKDVTEAVEQRDSLTRNVIGAAATVLGHCIGQLIFVVDPAKVVLAGPVALWGEAFLHPLRKAVSETVEPAGLKTPEIVHSTMGEYSGAWGAAALALHEWRPTIDPNIKTVRGNLEQTENSTRQRNTRNSSKRMRTRAIPVRMNRV